MCIGRVGFEVRFELILLQLRIKQRGGRAEQAANDRLTAAGPSGILILILELAGS